MGVKSPGVLLGLVNARPAGRAKLAKALPTGLTRQATVPPLAVVGGGGEWTQLELTDAKRNGFVFL